LYQFEELNRILVSFLHGFDLIGEEFFQIFLTARTLLNYSENINNVQIKNYIFENLKFKSSNKKRLFQNLACVKMLSKAEVTTNQLYLDLMKKIQMNEQTTLTMYSKIMFNGVYLSSNFLRT
jgi:hypothetical protein